MRVRVGCRVTRNTTISVSRRVTKALPGTTVSWWLGRLFR